MTRICRLQLQPQAGLISRVPFLFIYLSTYSFRSFHFLSIYKSSQKSLLTCRVQYCADLLSHSPSPLQLRTLDALLYIHSLSLPLLTCILVSTCAVLHYFSLTLHYYVCNLSVWGYAVAQFLEALCYKREVAVSIPNGVIVIFPFGRTVALGSTQPLTEMST
jgi:hypothetical protein